MSLNMFWFLPTHGDGHYLGTEEGSRPVDHGYLQQIAHAADRLRRFQRYAHVVCLPHDGAGAARRLP